MLRGTTATESTAWYNVWVKRNDDIVYWSEDSGNEAAALTTCELSTDWLIDTFFCVHIEGTGASTTVRWWAQPTGDLPADWGDPDCTLSATGSVDTGQFHGLMVNSVDVGISSNVQWFDASGGSCL